MPARTEIARGLIGLAAQFQNMRATFHRLDERIIAKGADLLGEGFKLIMAERLIGKPDNAMRDPRRFDSINRRAIKRARKVNARDLRAEARRIGQHADGGLFQNCFAHNSSPRIIQPSGTPFTVMRCMSRSWP